jgi:hypothetical protein
MDAIARRSTTPAALAAALSAPLQEHNMLFSAYVF